MAAGLNTAKKPKVTVIIPVYNTEKYLGESLDCVLSQTLRDLEIICVDDASTDHSGEILDRYAGKDRRVRVFHLPENRRQGYARNFALEQAQGEYIYYLDSDDLIEPETLAELYAVSAEENLDAVFFDARNLFDSQEMLRAYTPPFEKRSGIYPDHSVSGSELLDLFVRQDEWTCYPQRSFWKRAFLQREGIRYAEGCIHEDEYFAYAGILSAERVRYVPKQYFTLRLRADSVMNSKPAPRNFYGYLLNYRLMCAFAAERDIHTYGSDKNIARMYERCRYLWQRLTPEYDLREVCSHTEADRIMYKCFEAHMQYEDFFLQIDEEVLKAIRSHEHLYIYGAGVVGERFARKVLHYRDILLDGFLVSKAESRKVLCGRPVTELDKAELEENALVVVAVREGLLAEIAAVLDQRQINWTYFKSVRTV